MHARSLVSVDRPRARRRLVAAALGLGLLLGPLSGAGSAGTEAPEGGDRATRTVVTDRQRPDVDRPERERPDRGLEVLRLACRVAEGEPDATRIRIGCRWRPARSERAAGYQLWRIVDRGHRELVARGGLDRLGARDVVSAEASVVRYAVIAVDENGRRIGQSRVERIVLDDDPTVDRTRARASSTIR